MKTKIILETDEDKKIFVEAILNPPPANEKLKKAQENHKKFIENGKNKGN